MKSFEIEQRIRREGIEQGKAEGRSEGKAEDIMELLRELGEVPLSVQSQITSQKDDGILRAWLKLAAKVESIQEFTQKAFTALP